MSEKTINGDGKFHLFIYPEDCGEAPLPQKQFIGILQNVSESFANDVCGAIEGVRDVFCVYERLKGS